MNGNIVLNKVHKKFNTIDNLKLVQLTVADSFNQVLHLRGVYEGHLIKINQYSRQKV
jgi:hypothetical protein